MDDELNEQQTSEETAAFSDFPAALAIDAEDAVVGLKSGANTRFLFSAILAWLQQIFNSLFIPNSQKGANGGVATLNASGQVPGFQLDLSGKQDKITASGILKGDGAGGVSAATPGTDYGTYSKPSGGIPASDLANGVIPTVPSAYTSNPAMDGTASPGSSTSWAKGDHVHPSDTAKANQAQLAVVETGTTASVDHAVNTYFCWNGLLYRATAKISTGQSFTPGTNCEAVTAGGELLDRCRTMTAAVPKGKSVDIVITGNNYTPNHGFILLSTGNQLTRMMGAWLCFGLGIRYNYHVIQPLHTSGATSLSLTSTVDGKYTFTNNDSTYDCSITVAVLQEIGTGASGYLSLSAPY